ncbi:MAG TPA: Glu-tRNA(Gln) amidotransferase subunit GatE [archaeon]|nr:Glu-tRNA(Gln) amidotransferase subunit GatE [archaeon]
MEGVLQDQVVATDYQKIGFKCGIEVHNRLATETKLFCHCPARFSTEKPSSIVRRRLRPIVGELGTVDIAALQEYLKNRVYAYQVFSDTVCLIDIDEEPPMEMNREALVVALQVCKLLNAKIPDEIQVMRKIVLDGSDTTSFQRTAIVGLNGVLETSKGSVRITNISLEEESAGIVKKDQSEIVYRLDRSGIPLIEIGTAPDIRDPAHAKEVASLLGMLVRSTGKSQRGIGVTRQDVNVSVTGGARVEIKGFQDIDMIEKVIEKEVQRQLDIISKSVKPKEETRAVREDGSTEFMRPLPGEHRMYPETDVPPIPVTKEVLKNVNIPETWQEKSKRFEKYLPRVMAEQMVKSDYSEIFEELMKNNDPVLVANTLLSVLKDLRRKGMKTENIADKHLIELFSAIRSGKMSKEAIPSVLEIVGIENASVEEALKRSGLQGMSEAELRKAVKGVLSRHPELVKEKKISPLMGEVMKVVRGRISGQVVKKVLDEELGL